MSWVHFWMIARDTAAAQAQDVLAIAAGHSVSSTDGAERGRLFALLEQDAQPGGSL